MTPPTWPEILLTLVLATMANIVWDRWRHVRHRFRTGRCLECGGPVEDPTTPEAARS